MIIITSDHGGYELKTKLVQYFEDKNYSYTDLGPYQFNDEDDYPDYTIGFVKQMQEHPDNKGIIICRNGVGVSMMANKFKGVRAALSWDPKHAASSRNDDDTNVLALPADYIDEKKAQEIVDAWLNTEFSQETRHYRRLDKVANFGQQ